jgi:L-seryl-tRNA(Ser) seleniumtransferase
MGVYERLGVKTIINAWGTATVAGGSIMRPEVVEAMRDASRSFVSLPELLEKAGQRVAELAGVESAYITSGAAAGVAIGVAACMTGKDYDKVYQLPDTTGMRNEVIIQAAQRNPYDIATRLAGCEAVYVGQENGTSRSDMESAINEMTAAIVHFVAHASPNDLPLEQAIEIAREHDVPVIVDAAGEFPPFSVLRRYADMGADLTVFSGGKGLGGPQSSGLVLGRRDLTEACAVNGNPNHGVGRPMKAGKEEIVGVLTALELYADEEFQREQQRSWEERTSYMVQALSRVPGVTSYSEVAGPTSLCSRLTPEGIPITYVEWDAEVISKTNEEVQRELEEGSPGIAVGVSGTGISLTPYTLQPGDERTVCERMAQVLSAHAVAAGTTLTKV